MFVDLHLPQSREGMACLAAQQVYKLEASVAASEAKPPLSVQILRLHVERFLVKSTGGVVFCAEGLSKQGREGISAGHHLDLISKVPFPRDEIHGFDSPRPVRLIVQHLRHPTVQVWPRSQPGELDETAHADVAQRRLRRPHPRTPDLAVEGAPHAVVAALNAPQPCDRCRRNECVRVREPREDCAEQVGVLKHRRRSLCGRALHAGPTRQENRRPFLFQCM